MIVRSNGVVTYVGKDIANQFWKFGLLGRDFHYRRLRHAADGDRCGRRRPAATSRSPAVRRRGAVYNVIDSRQMYLQALLSQALRSLRPPGRGGELASTSPTRWWRCRTRRRASSATRRQPTEDAKKPFVEVSGRKGLGVKVDDLLDPLIAKAGAEVGEAQSELARRGPAADRAR